MVVISAILALWGGLEALYFDTNFGGPTDYLAALLWGLGTETAVSVLFEAVDRLGGLTSAGRKVLPGREVLPELAV